MKARTVLLYALALLSGLGAKNGVAQVPGIINHQGKLTVNGALFTGTAQFKFALVDAAANTTYWSHDGSSVNGSEPSGTALALEVSRGVFSVNLGDVAVPNMTQSIPAGVFTNSEVYVRTWVNDGVHGWQHLAPDRRATAAPYALAAQTVVGSVKDTALPAGATLVSQSAQDAALIAKGYRLAMTVAAPSWVNSSTTNALSARYGHVLVWDGQDVLIWGGALGSGSYSSAGSIYHPDADQWETISSLGAPAARSGHIGVWSGSELIVWGGFGSSGYLASGGKFNPATQTWSSITGTGAPVERDGHVGTWATIRLVIWGGRNGGGLLNDGACYDPVANQWSALNLSNTPEARLGATAVWTGNRLLVWGGDGASGPLNSGAQLVFSGSSTQWVSMNLTGAPSARGGHSAVWTGTKMLVWGGQSGGTALGDGAAYDPALDTWETLSTTNAPAARFHHCALWTGQEMLILDGMGAAGELASGSAYDPLSGLWRALSRAGAPLARTEAVAVWTGTEAVLFGGRAGGTPVGALQRLAPQPTWYFYRKL